MARACRAEPSLNGVRLIAASGYSASGNLVEALTAGFDSFLVKPLTEDALRSLVQ